MTRQLADPIVTHRDGYLKFTDADYGFRTPRVPSAPHVAGAATKKARQRAGDPVVGVGR